MSDTHIRAILLIVIASLTTGAGVAMKLAGYENAPSVMGLIGMVAFVAAIWLLICGDE